MQRRKSKRQHIEVDIEIAHPGFPRCYGVAENISRHGICVRLSKGELPAWQRSVILNFKIWTGIENVYRRLYARVVRRDEQAIGLEFAEQDFVAQAVIQDLLFYQRHRLRERRCPAATFAGRRYLAGTGNLSE
ncbi:MAG: PilZ domain-containing protein [Gammaproteobacteria bacterium]|jgi:hypothetical protein